MPRASCRGLCDAIPPWRQAPRGQGQRSRKWRAGPRTGAPVPSPTGSRSGPAGLVWDVGTLGAWERATPFLLVLSAWMLQESLRSDPSESGAPREEGGLPALLATGQTL